MCIFGDGVAQKLKSNKISSSINVESPKAGNEKIILHQGPCGPLPYRMQEQDPYRIGVGDIFYTSRGGKNPILKLRNVVTSIPCTPRMLTKVYFYKFEVC